MMLTNRRIPIIAVSDWISALAIKCVTLNIHPAAAAPIAQPSFCANTDAEKQSPVVRLLNFHSPKSATSANIVHSNGTAGAYAIFAKILKV